MDSKPLKSPVQQELVLQELPQPFLPLTTSVFIPTDLISSNSQTSTCSAAAVHKILLTLLPSLLLPQPLPGVPRNKLFSGHSLNNAVTGILRNPVGFDQCLHVFRHHCCVGHRNTGVHICKDSSGLTLVQLCDICLSSASICQVRQS